MALASTAWRPPGALNNQNAVATSATRPAARMSVTHDNALRIR